MAPVTSLQDKELHELFWSAKLPATGWTHSEHLRIAWLALEEWSLDEAHLLMRVGIIRLNAFHGLVETAQRGYHETITRVWLCLVAAAKRVDRGESSLAFLALHPGLTREAPLRHYSRGKLFSLEARSIFVDPDLEPLPVQ